MSEAATGLSRAEILRLLDLVALEAQRRELDVSLFLVGGAAMALAYSTSRATRDLDGAFEPKAAVYEIARVVASQVPELALREDWLNDAVKAFMSGEDVDAARRVTAIARPRRSRSTHG